MIWKLSTIKHVAQGYIYMYIFNEWITCLIFIIHSEGLEI